jgi:hypothetical protein
MAIVMVCWALSIAVGFLAYVGTVAVIGAAFLIANGD